MWRGGGIHFFWATGHAFRSNFITASIVVADIKVTKPQSKPTTAAFFVP